MLIFGVTIIDHKMSPNYFYKLFKIIRCSSLDPYFVELGGKNHGSDI